jgi:hypothetical protein
MNREMGLINNTRYESGVGIVVGEAITRRAAAP